MTLLFVSWMASPADGASTYGSSLLRYDGREPRTWEDAQRLLAAVRAEMDDPSVVLMGWRQLEPSPASRRMFPDGTAPP